MIDLKKVKPRVMVCPLNWGLGHASRCIPVIRKLQLEGFEVFAAAEGRAMSLLKEECPNIEFINLPGFSPSVSSGNNLILKIPGWMISLAFHTLKEHSAIQRLVTENNIDIVISDNRFGLFTTKAKCIFITHQIMFKTPRYLRFAEPLLYRINRFFIQKFDVCWIPDLPGAENLSGDLSHKYPLPKNAGFIGLLSRFSNTRTKESTPNDSLLALISGPEPQRSILEDLILDQLKKTKHRAIIISGTPAEFTNNELRENISQYNHLLTDELSEVILSAGIVISRSGYSTLMDLAVLGKKSAILVPTPGQTEQEYLAQRLQQLGWLNYQQQDKLKLDNIYNYIAEYKGIDLQGNETLLDMQVTAILSGLDTHPASS
jgi:uncharacterized protein (TIGR00661 family)